MPAADIANILSRLQPTSPYVTQEVVWGAGQEVQPYEYEGNGKVLHACFDLSADMWQVMYRSTFIKQQSPSWILGEVLTYARTQVPIYDCIEECFRRGRSLRVAEFGWAG
jgi:hypothetical protein